MATAPSSPTPTSSAAAAHSVPAGYALHNGFIATPPEPRSEWRLRDFDLLHKLGGGQYGSVYLASVRGCNMVVALKRLEIKQMVSFGVMAQLRREVEIAFHTRHQYLLRTYGYFVEDTDVYLIMEPCARGMLYSELSKVKRFNASTAARYVAQLAEALLYLHQHHILHRDIKPENILLDHNSNIKLADFGWSVHDPKNRRRTACGTPEYFPPEIVDRASYDTSADLWCLGIFCYELLVGKTPFADEKTDQIYKNIAAMEFAIPETVPDDAKDLIRQLLQRQGASRPSLHRILQHKFLMDYYYAPNNIEPPLGKRQRDHE